MANRPPTSRIASKVLFCRSTPLCPLLSCSSPCHSALLTLLQVQDVGLIFLSAMASAVVNECYSAHVSEADTVATALLTLTLSTSLVGLLIILTGEQEGGR